MRTDNFLKLTLGFVFCSTIAFANVSDPIKKNVENLVTEITALANLIELHSEYIEKVYENAKLEEARFLSGIVAEWDVQNSDDFDERNIEYRVIFRSNKGIAHAEYDNDGSMISVKKQFKNVALPAEVLRILANDYRGWIQVKNKYNVSYNRGREVSRTYILSLVKDGEKKNIRLQM